MLIYKHFTESIRFTFKFDFTSAISDPCFEATAVLVRDNFASELTITYLIPTGRNLVLQSFMRPIMIVNF
ncbi:MAG: hypothetical protein ACK5PB_19050, partial [Pirellula sp.]